MVRSPLPGLGPLPSPSYKAHIHALLSRPRPMEQV